MSVEASVTWLPLSTSIPRAPPTSVPRAVSINTVFEVDQNQPTTTLQIRLRDGERSVSAFSQVRVRFAADRPVCQDGRPLQPLAHCG
jgi:hypothetical protein